jgi:hypothetical protein
MVTHSIKLVKNEERVSLLLALREHARSFEGTQKR